jgi:hypothetical protein
MRLYEEMQTLEILVEFHAHFNKTHGNNSWCNDVELFIDYDTEAYFLRGMFLVFFERKGAMQFEGYSLYFAQHFLGRSHELLFPSEKTVRFIHVRFLKRH